MPMIQSWINQSYSSINKTLETIWNATILSYILQNSIIKLYIYIYITIFARRQCHAIRNQGSNSCMHIYATLVLNLSS